MGRPQFDATTIRSRDDLVAVVRRRQDELNVPCLTVDHVAGLSTGHFSKLTSNVKGFGLISIFLVTAALGLRIRIEEDPEATAQLRHRWTPRQFATTNKSSDWRTPLGDDSADRPAA